MLPRSPRLLRSATTSSSSASDICVDRLFGALPNQLSTLS
jgi:hypothetical protein